MAVQAEHMMSRDQILAGYLNAAFFGNQSYGIQVAAQRYFNTSAAKLTLPQAAMLAGIVENPSLYNPLGTAAQVQQTWTRRNTVLARMAQLRQIPASTAAAAEKTKLNLNPSLPQSGCTSRSAKYAAYMCDYVVAVIRHDTAYKQVWNRLNGIGGLTITTTLDPKDQRAANNAVNYVLPHPPSGVNTGKNADTEVLIQPGTGEVRAIAIDRPYGTGKHQNTINYAVGPQYVRVGQDRAVLRPDQRLHKLQGPDGWHAHAQRAGRLAGAQRRE
jgi:membrane peptidoglycan carboxypeptidase